MQVNRKSKLGKILVISGILLLFMGCDNASELYVKQQVETDAITSQNDGEDVNHYDSGQTDLNEISDDTKENKDELSEKVQENDKRTEKAVIYVQVSGAVKHPGVYQLEEGSRIFQAVDLAGGMTAEADINSINQAQLLSDGQMIYVYAIGEQLNPIVSGGQQEMLGLDNTQSDAKVNLNTATVEDLQTLPGIGQSKAESIISYREEHGTFENIEGLMDIPGIKEGVFSKIKDHIKVN